MKKKYLLIRFIAVIITLTAMLASISGCSSDKVIITSYGAGAYIDGEYVVGNDGCILSQYAINKNGDIIDAGTKKVFIKAENTAVFVPVSEITASDNLSFELQTTVVEPAVAATETSPAKEAVTKPIPDTYGIEISISPAAATCQQVMVTIENKGVIDFDNDFNNIVPGSEKENETNHTKSVLLNTIDGFAEFSFIAEQKGTSTIHISAADGRGAECEVTVKVTEVKPAPAMATADKSEDDEDDSDESKNENADSTESSSTEQSTNTDTNGVVPDSPSFVPCTARTGYIKGDKVNMRRGPATIYSVLGNYNNGTKVTILGTDNNWSKVTVNDVTGYINSAYISDTYASRPSTSVEQPTTTATPSPTVSTESDELPEPTEQVKPSEEPVATEQPEPSETPVATEQPEPSETPVATEQPKPSETPVATEQPKPTEEPTPTPTTEPIEEPSHTHKYTNTVIAPTCDSKGYTLHTCECGDAYKDSFISAKGHDYRSVVTAPTCENKGFTTYTCSACGKSYTADETAALGHAMNEGVVTKAPTCYSEGSKTYSCTRNGCTKTSTSTIAKTSHSWDDGTVTVAATCEQAGVRTICCSNPGCTASKNEEIPATGHLFEPGRYIQTGTCQKDAIREWTCVHDGCNATETHNEGKGSHSWVVDEENACVCVTKCIYCNEIQTQPKENCDHVWDEGTVTIEPICWKAGEMTYHCTNKYCLATKTEEIPKLGHDVDYETGEVLSAATCTEYGQTRYWCKRCERWAVTEIFNPLGHDWQRIARGDGTYYYECSRCKATEDYPYTDPFEIRADEIRMEGGTQYEMLEKICAFANANSRYNDCGGDANHVIIMARICGMSAEGVGVEETAARQGWNLADYIEEGFYPGGIGVNHMWARVWIGSDFYEVDASSGAHMIGSPNQHLYG